MFILKPDPYSTPAFRIGPFRTSDLSFNHRLCESDSIDEYFASRFAEKYFKYTENGRMAINIALSKLGLKENDIVSILTTSNNFYISGCVTNEIEKFCNWSRTIELNTKVIFVNHEFGYPYKDLHALKGLNLPIIEDCAGAFFSKDINNMIGEIGDYVIFSFPKMFPVQVGGMLVSNCGEIGPNEGSVHPRLLRHIKDTLSYYIKFESDIIERRFQNYDYLKLKFDHLGFKEHFPFDPLAVPSVFMFNTSDQIDLPALKDHYYTHGVQCSVFYGESAFFIPVHQALTKDDLDYFIEVFESFILKS